MSNWVTHYLMGIIFFGSGLWLAIGPAAILITIGLCLMLGGIVQFALSKTSSFSATESNTPEGK
jgi:predicted phage tail protein